MLSGNKESLRLPGWLKLLSLLALVLVGSPAVANAHGGHESDPAETAEYVAERNADQSVVLDLSEQARFFETAHHVPGSGPCSGSCCCYQGMTHCSASGCSLSALDGHHAFSAIDAPGTRLVLFEDQLPPRLRPSSGLERPPKRLIAPDCGADLPRSCAGQLIRPSRI